MAGERLANSFPCKMAQNRVQSNAAASYRRSVEPQLIQRQTLRILTCNWSFASGLFYVAARCCRPETVSLVSLEQTGLPKQSSGNQKRRRGRPPIEEKKKVLVRMQFVKVPHKLANARTRRYAGCQPVGVHYKP